MKNKRGFTLIELLAVIVILAIIALIAIPIILNMIEQSRKAAARDTAYGYIDAIEYNNGFASLGSDAEVSGYTKITSGNVSEITSTLGSHLKGKAPTSGSVVIDSNGKVESATNLCFNGYAVQYDGKDARVEGKCSGSSTPSIPTIDSCPGCVFAYYSGRKTIGTDILDDYTNDYREITNTHKAFLGFVLDDNDKIQRAFVCAINGSNVGCLEGNDTTKWTQEYNIGAMLEVFPGCQTYGSTGGSCNENSIMLAGGSNGDVNASWTSEACGVNGPSNQSAPNTVGCN